MSSEETTATAAASCAHCGWNAPPLSGSPELVERAQANAVKVHESRCPSKPSRISPDTFDRTSPVKLFGWGEDSPTRRYRWYLTWGWVDDTGGDLDDDDRPMWQYWGLLLVRPWPKRNTWLWRGRRRPSDLED